MGYPVSLTCFPKKKGTMSDFLRRSKRPEVTMTHIEYFNPHRPSPPNSHLLFTRCNLQPHGKRKASNHRRRPTPPPRGPRACSMLSKASRSFERAATSAWTRGEERSDWGGALRERRPTDRNGKILPNKMTPKSARGVYPGKTIGRIGYIHVYEMVI